MIRNALAAVIGLVIAIVTVLLVQRLGHTIYPPPPDLDTNNVAAMRTYISQLPLLALVFPIISYFLGALAGPFTASRIGTARPLLFAGGIGLILLAFTIATLIHIPHPHWFSALAIAAILLGAWLAMQLAGDRGELRDDD